MTVSTEGNFTLIDRALTRYCATIQKGSWSTSMPQLDLPVFNMHPCGMPHHNPHLAVLTRIVVDVGETSVVELELSGFPRVHGGLSCPTLTPG